MDDPATALKDPPKEGVPPTETSLQGLCLSTLRACCRLGPDIPWVNSTVLTGSDCQDQFQVVCFLLPACFSLQQGREEANGMLPASLVEVEAALTLMRKETLGKG